MLQTCTIADVARALALSEATVRHWVRAKRWPNGRPMRFIRLSDSPAADIRIFTDDVTGYVADCAKLVNPESAAYVAEQAGRVLKPRVSAKEQRLIQREADRLNRRRPLKPVAT